MAKRNRSRQDIIRDILAFLAIGPNRKTIIAGHVNTNYNNIVRMLAALHKNGFVKRSGPDWFISHEGHKLLDRLNAVEEMLREVA
jgi:predicted transcriptional regulator